MRLYNESRRRIKTLIKQAKRQYEENIAAESKHSAKMFYRYINSKKHIRSAIGPLKDNAGSLVTDDRRIANMLNKYFSSTPFRVETILTLMLLMLMLKPSMP